LKFWIEATHHGPSVNKPIMFYEIGPNSNAYNNIDYIKYYLESLNKSLLINPKFDNYILIGAPHYIDLEFIERVERKTNLKDICFSHIIPKYALTEMLNLDDLKLKDVLLETINKSKVNKIILNSDYMKSKSRFKVILEQIKLEKNLSYIII
jgi:D-aminoacyl-tRNA deacylase